MAQQLYFSRDTKVFIRIGSDMWEIPVLDGFSFSQATESSEIVLAEMESAGGVSRRGKRMFNDSLAPVDWNLTTYTRPFMANGLGGAQDADSVERTHAVEEVLWALMAGPAVYETNSFKDALGGTAYFNWTTTVTANPNDTLTIDWGTSNKSTLGTADIFFRVGDGTVNYKWYQIAGAVVNEATINFDIDGIASIEWSGFGSNLTEESEPAEHSGNSYINESVTSTTNFIRNRLTQLTLAPNQASYTTGQLENSYSVTLTGGSLTFSNNINYIVPEELGIVNIPIGHVTGNRSFSGSFTAYVVDDDGNTTETGDFWADVAVLTDVVTHDFDMDFYIGGQTGDPRLQVSFPSAAIEIPTHNIEDIISLECNFSGLGSSIDATDEVTVTYLAS
jgi:hypothetical protein